VDLRPCLRFALEHPGRPNSDFFDREVELESRLEVRGRLVINSQPRARAPSFGVGVAVGEYPRSFEAPRTEELAFAGSSGSGGDRRLGKAEARQRRADRP
jgi:hypothetical protein